jgi:uncharacterized Tic20 family protein
MTEPNEIFQPSESPAAGNQTEHQVSTEQIESKKIGQPESSKEAKSMAMLCHLLGIVGFFAPLVIWLNEKDKHRFVDEHGRAVMNYQVSIMIYYIVCWLLCFVLIGLPLLISLSVLHVIFVIIGSVKASRGNPWRYPIAIPFLR